MPIDPQFWNPLNFGCIDRAGFQLRGVARTAITTVDVSPLCSRRADVRAPIEANFQTAQTYAQHAAFTQWVRYDLAGGALPFSIDLWLWDHTRRVRARLLGEWSASRQTYNGFTVQGVMEIERESIT